MKKTILFILIVALCPALKAQNWNWAKKYGTTNADYGIDIASDFEGAVYTAGRSLYGVEFETDTLISPCIHLTKFDSLGNELWVNLISHPGAGNTWTQVDTDSDNNVYLFDKLGVDTLVIDQDSLFSSNGQFLLAKFDSDGTLLWSKEICKTSSSFGNDLRIGDMDVSSNNEIHICGAYADTAIFDQDTLFMENGRAFVARYDEDGNQLMVGQYGGYHETFIVDGYGLAADDNGCTYISGRFEVMGYFGQDTVLTQSYVNEMFIVKFSPSGQVLWHKQATGLTTGTGGIADEISSFCLDWDNNGHVIAAGMYNTDVQFGDSTIIHPHSKAYYSGFVAKYDTTGNLNWVQHEDKFYFFGVDCDYEGNIYLAGLYRDSINFWGTDLQAPYLNLDALVARLDSSGVVQWVSATDGRAGRITVAAPKCASSKIYVTGEYSTYSLVMGGINLAVPTQNDMFVACLQNNYSGTDCTDIGLQSNTNSKQLDIYPNPTTSGLNLQYHGNLEHFSIYDLSGKLVETRAPSALNQYQLDMSSLRTGIYIIELKIGDDVLRKRVVKQ